MLWRGIALLVCSCSFVMLACNIPLRSEADANQIKHLDSSRPKIKIIEVTETPVSTPVKVATRDLSRQEYLAKPINYQLVATATPRFTPTAVVMPVASDSAALLSPIWKKGISRWAVEIAEASQKHGVDRDLIASVVFVESSGNATSISGVGAVGLMGVMSSDVGFGNRPNEKQLFDPATNLSWGSAILAEILRQTGGDLHTALAAYNGGWEYVNLQEPQKYATHVLDLYGRAVAKRIGLDPEMAQRWTVGITLPKGELSAESLIFGERVTQNLPLYGEHVVYQAKNKGGRSYYIKGYVVPIEPKITQTTTLEFAR